jgi:predicted metal-dependent phosphoesterase TrpH
VIRADFHCHTRWSHDCFADIPVVLDWARRRELTHLAITDHDQIEGALRARDASRDVQIIVGCEVTLPDHRHLIGLFLDQVPAGKDATEVAADIRAQGGLVYVPHPFQPRAGLGEWAGADAIEAVSGYEPPERNARAARLAGPLLAGSDAHYGVDVGRACVEFPAVTGALTPEVLRQAARQLYVPRQDLSALHARDAAVRAGTLPGLRPWVPAAVRRWARRANWERFRRQVAAACGEPVRTAFVP